jgi:hypothetical protein
MFVNCDTTDRTLSFAARELAAYLGRMLPQCDDLDLTLAVTADNGVGGREQFRVQMTPHGGTITGDCSRSVLLGVYDYLRHLGCRFLAPGKDAERVPSIIAAQLTADYEKQPSFRHRGVCIEGANSLENVLDFVDWLPKVGYNSFFLQFKIPYTFLARWYHHEENPFRLPEPYSVADAAEDMAQVEDAMAQRGLMLHKVGHGWTGEVLGYEAVAWSPDYHALSPALQPRAALRDGERSLFHDIPLNTNLCYANGEAVDAFVRSVVDYARENPAVDYLHIWLADDYNNLCECEACQETTLSDQYVALLNEIDRRLTAEGLATKLVFLLYQELLWPPQTAKLENPDRFVLMFAPISRTFSASYDLSSIPEALPPFVRNQITLPTSLGENLAFLRSWQQSFTGDSFVYDYPLGRAHFGDLGYVGLSRVISGDVKQLHAMGLDGYISCQELRAALPNALPNYVMGLTLFDERADVDDLIAEYFAAAYGRGADAALDHLTALSKLSSCDYLNGKGPRKDPDMARRFAEIETRCRNFAPQGTGLFWDLLDYHSRYAALLARAMTCLAHGNRLGARDAWLSMRCLLCENEPDFQPWFDVYRLLEVTKKYTGFGPLVE